MEASACGIPVVVSNVGGLPEVVEKGKTGILVPPRDPERAADAILSILNSPDKGNSIGAAGRLFVSKYFDWVYVSREMSHVYSDFLNL